MRESLWLFPAIETLHLLGMAVMVASIGALDLRLLGWAMPGERVSRAMERLLPWAWAGFAVQLVTGALLFSSEATHMVRNPAFRVKMALLIFAGFHALVFRLAVYRNVAAWDESATPPVAARVAGLLSLLIWVGVVAAGRFIGFI